MTDADVIIGQVQFDDAAAKFIPNNNQEGVYTDYHVIHRYESDRHTYMAGITSPGGFQNSKAAFFRLAAPTLLWIADWTALRFGDQPKAPDPYNLTNANWILLDVIPETKNIVVGPDGITPVYRISGVYVYGHKNPSDDVFDDVQYPRPPWLDSTGILRRVAEDAIIPGLIEIRE